MIGMICGEVLLDKLESVYSRNLDEKGNDASLSADYIFHEVQPGETVYSISRNTMVLEVIAMKYLFK